MLVLLMGNSSRTFVAAKVTTVWIMSHGLDGEVDGVDSVRS